MNMVSIGNAWLQINDISDAIGFTSTCLINAVLISLLVTRGKKLGTYRYLMMFFCVFTVFYALIESILRPILHIEHSSLFLISRKRFDVSPLLAKLNSGLYCACFASSFVLVAVHFVYRYFVACKPHLLYMFEPRRLIFWLLLALIPISAWACVSMFLYPNTEQTEDIVIMMLRDNYYPLSRQNVTYIGYIYYTYNDKGEREIYMKNILGFIVHSIVMNGSFYVIFHCGKHTYETVRYAIHVSNRTKILQKQLFNALVIQTILPSLIMYIPILIMFIFPFLNISLRSWTNIVVVSSFIYPGIDPLILILVIKDFRITVAEKLQLKRRKSNAIRSFQISSTNHTKSTNHPMDFN